MNKVKKKRRKLITNFRHNNEDVSIGYKINFQNIGQRQEVACLYQRYVRCKDAKMCHQQ